MTTQSWNTPLQHTNDGTFRAWGSELSARLAAIGLVQTSDTGQINWTTVTRPAINTAAGYEIWRFNDSLQGSSPIFLKVEYGTATGAVTNPFVWITAGTGTNGSGTLTGSVTNRMTAATAASATSATNWPSYACCVEGLAWVAGKWQAAGATRGTYFFAVSRTCDNAGTPTGDGFVLYASAVSASAANPAQVQAIRAASPATVFARNTDGLFSMIVHGVTTTLTVAGDTQAYLHWMPTPDVRPVFAFASLALDESTFGATFSTTLVGSTPRTYLSIHTHAGAGGANGSTANTALALVYE